MNVRETDYFRKQLKKLARHFPSVYADLATELADFCAENVINLGRGIFKLRIRNSDIPCGKSGGYRAIIFYVEQQQLLIPLIIYSKRKQGNITTEAIERALAVVLREVKSK